MQKISPFLWFDNNAEEALNFYCSIFDDSKITAVSYYNNADPVQEGKIRTISFELNGQQFAALNGGPLFKFTEAVSFVIWCETQGEIDEKWEKLTDGGQGGQCGWLKDKYGLSWQLVPRNLIELLTDKNPEKTKRVSEALFKMGKLDLKVLQGAYDAA
jgi:predicted 3-demethylubiquinone-9 3-methyltransferase (glyoxalase superfamily)